MSEFKFNKDYFSPRVNDGNMSFSSRSDRIKEALKLLENKDDYILIDNTKCYNEQELRKALEKAEEQSESEKEYANE